MSLLHSYEDSSSVRERGSKKGIKVVDLKHNKKQSQAPLHWTLKSHKKWLYLHYHEAKLTVKKRNQCYRGNFTWTCVKYNLVLKSVHTLCSYRYAYGITTHNGSIQQCRKFKSKIA